MQACRRATSLVPGRRSFARRATSSSRRALSSWGHDPQYETVEVRCASSGSIAVDLHNLLSYPSTTPLLIYLPPFSSHAQRHGSTPASLPSFCARYPTAVIHYRWPEDAAVTPPSNSTTQAHRHHHPFSTTPLHWPTPIHDTLFAYEWIIKNLAPEGRARRDIYVYGSYLGASLGASLSLTESHKHQRMAVRGMALFNGVYDWTRFLPDHPSNTPKKHSPSSPFFRRRHSSHNTPSSTTGGIFSPEVAAAMIQQFARDNEEADTNSDSDNSDSSSSAGTTAEGGLVSGSRFHYIKHLIPTLFKTPSTMFDPFASPCLFFHTAGMLAPPSFEPSSLPPALLRAVAELSLDDSSTPAPGSPEAACLETAFKAPRKGYLAFPPRQSSLRIPEALVLHEAAPPRLLSGGRRRPSAARSGRATSAASAVGTATTTKAKAKATAKAKAKSKAKFDGSNNGSHGNSFAAQAEGFTALMRRSVNMLELKERRQWDQEFDDWDSEAERRIRVEDVGDEAAAGVGEEAIEGVVGKWLDERAGR